ncbi:MAG: hypothetical protein E7242_08220 [Lachnospiraceae bacterium]|nr:hypothetical protein [Lachnospiraceae bacterium]
MRKGRIIKGLAMAIIAVMVLGCLSLNNTSAATVNHSSHIDIRTNAAITLSDDGSLDGVTISKDNISYVGYKVGNATNFTAGKWQQLTDGREKYEVKYNVSPSFDVYDETLQILIKGTYSNGETIGKDGEGIIIDQTTTYPDNTYIEYNNTSGKNTIYAMKHFGIEKVTIDGKDYYDVSNKSIISVAIAMCNGVKAERTGDYAITVCGTDFYLNPQIIKIIEDQDELTVKKNWTNVEGNLIPSNVTVQLYKDNVALEGKTATLSADNDWTAVIKYTKEEGAEYTVKEIAIDGVAVGNTAYTYTADVSTSYGSITFEDTKVALDTIKEDTPATYWSDGHYYTYFVETLDNAFGVAKMKDKDVYVVWTYKALPDSDKQLFIDAINAKGDISGLTMENTEFRVGTDADSYPYTVGEYSETTKEGSYKYPGSYSYYDGRTHYYSSEAEATTEMNKYIASLSSNIEVTDANVFVVSGELTESTEHKYKESDWYSDKNQNKAFKKAEEDLNKAIAELKKDSSNTNIKGNILNYGKYNNKYYCYYYINYDKKVQSDSRQWSYTVDYTETIVNDTRETRTLSFTYDDNFKFERENRNCKAEVFNFSNRADWDYLYDGRFTSESTPDETTIIVSNTYADTSSITGSKTFDMQNQSDIAVPVNEDGTPKIDVDVYKNDVALADSTYDIAWERVGTTNTWNFTITGDAITKYYDSDSNGKLDSVASYTVKEAGEEDGVINIDNFDYKVVYGDNNAITNTLDTSSFVGDLTINKTIDDVNPVNGKAIFTYKIEGQGKTYYAVIVVDSETKTGSTTLKGLKIGNYTVTELNTMRFAQTSVTPDGGAASVTRNGEAKVDFTNTLKVRTNFSHTDVTVNHFTKTADGISISEENDDAPTVETRTAIVAPAYR